MVAGRAEMAVVGASLLVAVDRRLGKIHVQDDFLGIRASHRFADPGTVYHGQRFNVLFRRQCLGLEARDGVLARRAALKS